MFSEHPEPNGPTIANKHEERTRKGTKEQQRGMVGLIKSEIKECLA